MQFLRSYENQTDNINFNTKVYVFFWKNNDLFNLVAES